VRLRHQLFDLTHACIAAAARRSATAIPRPAIAAAAQCRGAVIATSNLRDDVGNIVAGLIVRELSSISN
jgi:hypothetical protein